MQPNYSPNVTNQTVDYGGKKWRGQPGGQWQDISSDSTTGQQQAVTDTANQAQNNFNTLRDTNQKNVTDFLANYKSDAANAIQGANQQFDVPGQVNYTNSLNTRIRNLAGNLDNSGAGGFANMGQVDSAISSRLAPELTSAREALANSSLAAQQQEGIALQPDKDYGNLLATNIQTAMQGLTSTEQAVLAAIEENLKQGVSLTEQQVSEGNKISQNALDRAQALSIEKLKQQNAPIGQGNVIRNPVTGQIVNPYMLASQNKGVYTPTP